MRSKLDVPSFKDAKKHAAGAAGAEISQKTCNSVSAITQLVGYLFVRLSIKGLPLE